MAISLPLFSIFACLSSHFLWSLTLVSPRSSFTVKCFLVSKTFHIITFSVQFLQLSLYPWAKDHVSPQSGERKFTLPAVHDSCLQAPQLAFLSPEWENSSLGSVHEQISFSSQTCHAVQNFCPGSTTREALAIICREFLFTGRQQQIEMYPAQP